MSYSITGYKVGTLLAASDLSSNQFYFGKINTSGAIALCGIGGDAMGVLNAKVVSMGRYGRTKKIRLEVSRTLIRTVFGNDARIGSLID